MPNPNPMFMESTMPFSLEHSRSMFGGTDPKKIALLIPNLFTDYKWFPSPFGGALVAADWSTAVSAGGGPTAFAFSAVRGGVVQGATGTTDNDGTALYRTQTFLDPADNPFLVIVWRSNVVTGFSFEIGFSDPKSDEALPGVTDVDTPTVGNGVTDIACVHMDTDQDLTTASLVGDGTTGAATKTDIGTYTPTAAAWQTTIVGVRPNLCFAACFDGKSLVSNRKFSASNGPDSGVLVRPYAAFRTRNTTTKEVDIAFFGFGCEITR